MLSRFVQIFFLVLSSSGFSYTAYVADAQASAVFVIDTETQSVLSTVSAGSFTPFGFPDSSESTTYSIIQQTPVSVLGSPAFALIAVTPDNSQVYLTPVSPAEVEVMDSTSYSVNTVNNSISIPFASPRGVAIKNSTTPIPNPPTGLYDLNRLRLIYDAEVIEARELLRQAGIR